MELKSADLAKELKCLRPACGHTWRPKQLIVNVCPKCKSPYWNQLPKLKRKEGAKKCFGGK